MLAARYSLEAACRTPRNRTLHDSPNRLVTRHVLWRTVNDRIAELDEVSGHLLRLPGEPWVRCECGRSECEEGIAIEDAQYRAVRSTPTRFLVVPGHEFEEIERVVERHEGFVVVEVYGPPAEIATPHR